MEWTKRVGKEETTTCVLYRSRGVCAGASESCGSLKQVSWALGSPSRAGVRVSVVKSTLLS
eukprot:6420155-Prorocentrum_lima.AAC.1